MRGLPSSVIMATTIVIILIMLRGRGRRRVVIRQVTSITPASHCQIVLASASINHLLFQRPDPVPFFVDARPGVGVCGERGITPLGLGDVGVRETVELHWLQMAVSRRVQDLTRIHHISHITYHIT